MKKIILLATIAAIFSCNSNTKNDMQTAQYSGKDISTIASIKRDKVTKKASLDISLDGTWTLYAGKSVDSINFSAPIAKGDKKGSYPLSINDSTRTYFQLVTDEGKAILAENHLPMTGGYNFRDLGGIKTKEGKYVKWGKVFRSDELVNLTDADLMYLSSIPLTTIVDFRSESEITQAPDKNPTSVAHNYALSMDPGNILNLATIKKPGANVMSDLYKLLVSNEACIAKYKEFFALLQTEANSPLMYHCSAGKDRTGIATALFLSALGVEEDVIIKDYLSSNIYLGDKYAAYAKENPEMKSLFEVQPEYLMAAFETIRNEHQSVDNYLTSVLGVDIQKIKALYLY